MSVAAVGIELYIVAAVAVDAGGCDCDCDCDFDYDCDGARPENRTGDAAAVGADDFEVAPLVLVGWDLGLILVCRGCAGLDWAGDLPAYQSYYGVVDCDDIGPAADGQRLNLLHWEHHLYASDRRVLIRAETVAHHRKPLCIL